jgi:hypothetical protein
MALAKGRRFRLPCRRRKLDQQVIQPLASAAPGFALVAGSLCLQPNKMKMTTRSNNNKQTQQNTKLNVCCQWAATGKNQTQCQQRTTTHTYMHKHAHTRMHAHTHRHTHTHTQAHTHTCAHTHTFTHTHTHTHSSCHETLCEALLKRSANFWIMSGRYWPISLSCCPTLSTAEHVTSLASMKSLILACCGHAMKSSV